MGIDDPIIFSDYYTLGSAPKITDLVQVIDPVNAENNVSSDYDQTNLDCLVNEALAAGDAIEAANYAPTKHETVSYWREIFGNTFTV